MIIPNNLFEDNYKNYMIDEASIENIYNVFNDTINYQEQLDEEYTDISLSFFESLTEAKRTKSESMTLFTSKMISIYKIYTDNFQRRFYSFSKAFSKKLSDDVETFKEYDKFLSNYDKKGNDLNVGNTRFKYTHVFDNEVPSRKVLDTLIEYRLDMDKIINFSGSSVDKLKLIKDEYSKLSDYIKSGKCYSDARGKLLGTNEQINAENFPDEIFKVFRDGGKVLSERVTPNEVVEAYTRYKKYDNLVADLARERRDVHKEYMQYLKYIKSIDIAGLQQCFGEAGAEFDKFYAMYIKMRADQLIRLSQLNDQVIAGKLDAIVKSYIQDRSILIAACGNMQEEIKYNDVETLDEYAIALETQRYNSIRCYLAMLEACGMDSISLNESTIISLDEAAFDNLKNFLINICKKISDVLGQFGARVDDLMNADKKFLADNKNIILSDVKIQKPFKLDNYYPYGSLVKKVSALNFKGISSAELEAKAENKQWQTPEDYIKTDGKPNIEGFVYNPDAGIKEQVLKALKGEPITIGGNQVGPQMRQNLFNYCTNEFPNMKELTNADLAALKQFGKAMDTYLASAKNGTQTQFNQEVNVKSSSEVQAQNASYTYEDTMRIYFNEDGVDIKPVDSDPNAAGIPKNQAAADADNKKAEADSKKEKETAISNAVKSYIKANSQIMSAKMSAIVTAEKQSMKILKWYVKEYNNQTGKGKEKPANKNNPEGGNQNKENESIAANIKG